MLILYALMVFMLVGAVVAVWMRGLLSSVVSVGAVGMGLCIMFLFLQAPDLAIAQLVVEILCLIILIRATLGRGIARISKSASPWIFLVFVAFSFMFCYAAFLALKQMPAFGHPIMRVAGFYLDNTLRLVRATNIVSAVILDFRAYDTLGEATVLFTAVMGVMAVMRVKGRKKIDERDEPNR